MRPISSLWYAALVFWGAGFLLCGFLFYELYWRWRGCFNELGRCFVEELGVVHREQSGEATAILTLLFATGFLVTLVVPAGPVGAGSDFPVLSSRARTRAGMKFQERLTK